MFAGVCDDRVESLLPVRVKCPPFGALERQDAASDSPTHQRFLDVALASQKLGVGGEGGTRETVHPVVAPCAGEVRERDVTRDRRPRRGCGGGRGKEPLPAGVAAGWGGSTQNIRGAERNGTSAARAMSPSSFFGERKSSAPRRVWRRGCLPVALRSPVAYIRCHHPRPRGGVVPVPGGNRNIQDSAKCGVQYVDKNVSPRAPDTISDTYGKLPGS